MRSLAWELLNQWERKRAYSETLLDRAFKRKKGLSHLDKAFTAELFYGTLRYLNQLDYIIDCFSKVNPKRIKVEVRNLLRLGIYQILYLRVPDAVAVYETVELAKGRFPIWIVNFLNALLRKVVREKENIKFPKDDLVTYLSLKYAYPDWLIRMWLKTFGKEDTIRLCKINNTPSPIVVRTNTLKTTREDLKRYLALEGIMSEPTRFSPDGLILREVKKSPLETTAYKNGYFFMQSEASQLIGYLLDPRPGEKILDGCAGVGGKATHLAQIMKNRGRIYAIESKEGRFRLLNKNLNKLGIKNVFPKLGDLRDVIKSFSHRYFDRILIDAPCSSLGALRKNVDIKWRHSKEDISRLRRLQETLLEEVVPYLRQKGVLLYTTCTFTAEENEEVIETFLKRHPDFSLENLANLYPNYRLLYTPKGYLKTLPHVHDLDGFFAARLSLDD